jgi:hypothetical protein
MNFNDLMALFTPGIAREGRHPNRLRKGYLKKSMFTSLNQKFSLYKPHQGKKECLRRLKQIA